MYQFIESFDLLEEYISEMCLRLTHGNKTLPINTMYESFVFEEFTISTKRHLFEFPGVQSFLVQHFRCVNLKTRNKRLLTELEKQGFKKKIFKKSFVKFYRSHFNNM